MKEISISEVVELGKDPEVTLVLPNRLWQKRFGERHLTRSEFVYSDLTYSKVVILDNEVSGDNLVLASRAQFRTCISLAISKRREDGINDKDQSSKIKYYPNRLVFARDLESKYLQQGSRCIVYDTTLAGFLPSPESDLKGEEESQCSDVKSALLATQGIKFLRHLYAFLRCPSSHNYSLLWGNLPSRSITAAIPEEYRELQEYFVEVGDVEIEDSEYTYAYYEFLQLIAKSLPQLAASLRPIIERRGRYLKDNLPGKFHPRFLELIGKEFVEFNQGAIVQIANPIDLHLYPKHRRYFGEVPHGFSLQDADEIVLFDNDRDHNLRLVRHLSGDLFYSHLTHREEVKQRSIFHFTLDAQADNRFEEPFSATALNLYLQCPYRFYLRYIKGIMPCQLVDLDLNALELGNVAHGILEQYHKQSRIEFSGKLTFLELRHEIRARIEEIQVEQPNCLIAWQVRELKELLIKMLCLIEKDHPKLVSSEEKITEKLLVDGEYVDITGKIDRIDEISGRRRVIDFKTGGVGQYRPIKGEFRNLQLPLYLLLVPNALGLVINIHGEMVEVDQGDGERVAAVIRAIRAQQFWPPRIDPLSYFQ